MEYHQSYYIYINKFLGTWIRKEIILFWKKEKQKSNKNGGV